MPMEGDSFASSAPATPIYTGPDFAAPQYVSPEQRWAAQARADESSIQAALKNRPTFVGGPTGMNITPVITGGYTGTGGPEGDRSYTPQVFEGYRSYDPATRMQYGWSGTGEYLGSQYIPKDDPWSGLKDFATKFVLPSVGMFAGVNALGSIFGSGGALGGLSGATASAAEQAAAADIAGGMVPQYGSNAAYDAFMNNAIASGTAGAAPQTLPSIFADTTVPYTPSTDYGFAPDYGLGPSTSGQGIQAPVINEPITVGTAPIDYSLTVPSQIGLQLPTMPSLPGMGGAQGLTVAVPGGTVGELGFTASGASPILGSPSSFINNPAITGQPSVPSAPSVPSTPSTPSGLSGLSPDVLSSLSKLLPGLIGAGAGGLLSGGGGTTFTPLPAYAPKSTMPQYTPEYFQQIQQRYNQILPSQPMDVATPLSQWYNKPADSSIVTKLFGVS